MEFVFKFSSHIVWYFPFVFELDLEMPEIRVLHIERRADVFCPKKNKSENHLAGLPTSRRWRKIQGANLV
ncbi:hypothetical protein, partial [Pseudomonas sp. GW456-12-10-14-LB2]|uniref:hypothetical protein n=1 Tax=Pseudomonas sp. GW456-12-10-14-LB2 TaxID=2070674 RepID=UPI001C44B003